MIQKAREAQKIWAQTSIEERCQWLKKFQKLLVYRQNEVVAAIQADTHKPKFEALSIELMSVLMTADYYRKKSKKFLKSTKAKPHLMFLNKKVVVYHRPYGVVGILGPSNLPFSLTIGDSIPALLAGNTVIIKPSELTLQSARLGLALALEAGLPPNIMQIIEGGAEIGNQLIDDVDLIFFTGSTSAGRKVAVHAAELLKPCILELGGKAPMIVLEDANIARAARAAVWGRFANGGQHCIAVERIYVDQKIAPLFIDAVVKQTKKINPEHLTPPIVSKTTPHFKELLQDAIRKGAQIEYQQAGRETPPTILTHVDHTMRVMREESFSPLLPIMTFQNIEEAISLANESESGLSAYLFTKDPTKIKMLTEKMESGSIAINDCMDHFMVMDAPFGGWKQSGLGIRHSKEGLLQFTKPQMILSHRCPLPFSGKKEFWWFPYNKWAEKLTRGLIKIFFG